MKRTILARKEVMKIKILFTTSLVLVLGHAHAKVEVVSPQENVFFIQGNSCEEIAPEVAALQKYNMRHGKAVGEVPKKCEEVAVKLTTLFSKTKFQVNVTELMPEFVFLSYGSLPAHHGFNCHSVSMVGAGLAAALRLVAGPEFYFIFENSPFCRILSANEEPQPGDIINVSSYGDRISSLHSFLFLSENISLNKDGAEGTKLEFLDIKTILGRWNSPNHCQKLKGNPPECENSYRPLIVRCEPAALLDSYKSEIDRLEILISKKLIGRVAAPFKEKSELQIYVSQLSELNDHIRQAYGIPSEEKYFDWKKAPDSKTVIAYAHLLRIDSMLENLRRVIKKLR